jgi:hypothetical protein
MNTGISIRKPIARTLQATESARGGYETLTTLCTRWLKHCRAITPTGFRLDSGFADFLQRAKKYRYKKESCVPNRIQGLGGGEEEDVVGAGTTLDARAPWASASALLPTFPETAMTSHCQPVADSQRSARCVFPLLRPAWRPCPIKEHDVVTAACHW